MSTYYRYEFISPQHIYAEVKEELRSYFASSAVDDIMFPLWTQQCLLKLGKGSFEIIPSVLHIKNYKSRLPDDFQSVREAWMCRDVHQNYQLPSAEYSQVLQSYKMTGETYCNVCNTCGESPVVQEIYKNTQVVHRQWSLQYLLKPSIINDLTCPKNLYCANFNSISPQTYDVKNGQFLTTIKEATIYLLYYSNQFDSKGDVMIPKDYRIERFIAAFLKQKIFEQLFNQSTSETFNQSKFKYEFYKQLSDEAFILADTETKKETLEKSFRAAKRVKQRFNKFEIR